MSESARLRDKQGQKGGGPSSDPIFLHRPHLYGVVDLYEVDVCH
jgi:hypothetical protein